jgi:hypothetical protein
MRKQFSLDSLSAVNKLDFVLDWFANSPNARPSATISQLGNSVNAISGDNYRNNFTILLVELQRIVDQLVVDGYLTVDSADLDSPKSFGVFIPDALYSVTFRGQDFNIHGGYVEAEAKGYEADRLKKIQDELVSNQYRLSEIQAKAAIDNISIQKKLVALNGWIAFAAVVAAIYYVTQLVDWIMKFFCSCK